MIRIDEIYYNTFVKYLQDRDQTCVHSFDPFGTVQFKDLKNSHAIHNKNRDAERYLFWDQEPIHTDLFEQFATEYMPVYDGVQHLITSEYNSDAVTWACDTYGFVPHYYFFHGWAALDWYRGYDRTFLIKPYKQRCIEKTFLSPNRIVGGGRSHRLLMLYYIFKYDLLDNYISCPAICPGTGETIEKFFKPMVPITPDIESVYAKIPLPIVFSGEENAPMTSYKLDLFDESSRSLLYLVTETVATGRKLHLTEKTFKPICLMQPFVILSTQGALAYLRRYGFQTFDRIWDETYDTIEDDNERVRCIADLLRDLSALSQPEKQDLFDSAYSICLHNYQHFYSGAFEQILWTELTEMLSEF